MTAARRTQLKRRVQQLGRLRAELGDLQTAERQLTEVVREGMLADRDGPVESADYVAVLGERHTLHLDAAKFRRKAGDKVFMECAQIDAKVARRHFTDAVLQKLGSVSTTTQLRLTRRVTVKKAS